MLGSLGVYMAQFSAAAAATHTGLYVVHRSGPSAGNAGRGPDDFPKTEVYRGPGKIESYEPYETALQGAGKTMITQRYTWHVNHAAGPFEIGDVVTMIGFTTGLPQPDGLNHQYRIAGLLDKELATAQRFLVDVIVAKTATTTAGQAPPGQDGGSD